MEITNDILIKLGFKYYSDKCFYISIIFDSEGLSTNCDLKYFPLYNNFSLLVQQGGGEEEYQKTELALPFIKSIEDLILFVKLLINIDLSKRLCLDKEESIPIKAKKLDLKKTNINSLIHLKNLLNEIPDATPIYKL